MLNISKNQSIQDLVHEENYSAYRSIEDPHFAKKFLYWLGGLVVIFIIFAFLPWRQNVISKGFVTTLRPEQRPQTVQSVIAGRIEQWYVREGDMVQAGDTIVHISDVKDEYFDPELLQRQQEQIEAKKGSMESYSDKAQNIEEQIAAMKRTRDLKKEQAEYYLNSAQLKVRSDSAKYAAKIIDYETAVIQYEREKNLFERDLTSRTELENKFRKLQKIEAEQTEAMNALLSSRNELVNARLQLSTIENEFGDKLAKAYADRDGVLSSMYEARGSIAKMTNQLANYEVRYRNYYITAPQTGLITEAIRAGIGEVIKEGEKLVSIMPQNYQLAVEMYVDPVDIPLFSIGNDVRFIFDGWPAVVFSGWPDLSYGTFAGEVFAIDRFTNGSGKFRILIAPDPEARDWPEGLSIGTGAKGIALLKRVPVWYEIWRRLNGFPPDYYKPVANEGLDKSTVKTLKRLK